MTRTPSQPTTLLLIRHGETDANRSGIWQGASDSPLNDRGLAQAQAVAQRLQTEARPLSAIYTSPLQRARQTAQAIAAQIKLDNIQITPELAEFNLGEWEGLSYEALRHEKRLWDRMNEDPNFAPPGGESAVQFATRLISTLRTIAQTHAGEQVVVISHGGAIATALAMLLEQNGRNWPKYQMANCGLSELRFAPQPQLIRFNEIEHLQGIGNLKNWR